MRGRSGTGDKKPATGNSQRATGNRRRAGVQQVLSATDVREAGLASGFTLVGLARAEPLDPAHLRRWLDAGYAAGMSWMSRRLEERLDPGRVLRGARTVVALAIAYHRPDAEVSPVARYARGRDYHYTHRDRMRALRRRLLALCPDVETYACVDTGVAMEKVWAERAGLGWIGKNGCLIHPQLGSWLTLSVMFLDRSVDHYDKPHEEMCGPCRLCLGACPTGAFPSPGIVDARRCISYQTIENRGPVPEDLRRGFEGRVFGCDVCQEVCPFNRIGGRQEPLLPADRRRDSRPMGLMSPAEIAALDPHQHGRLSPGTAMARAGYDGLRRNALLSIGAARDASCRDLAQRLCRDPSPEVADVARWALGRLTSPR